MEAHPQIAGPQQAGVVLRLQPQCAEGHPAQVQLPHGCLIHCLLGPPARDQDQQRRQRQARLLRLAGSCALSALSMGMFGRLWAPNSAGGPDRRQLCDF